MAGLTEEEKEILFKAHAIKERLRAEELEAGEITVEEAERQALEEERLYRRRVKSPKETSFEKEQESDSDYELVDSWEDGRNAEEELEEDSLIQKEDGTDIEHENESDPVDLQNIQPETEKMHKEKKHKEKKHQEKEQLQDDNRKQDTLPSSKKEKRSRRKKQRVEADQTMSGRAKKKKGSLFGRTIKTIFILAIILGGILLAMYGAIRSVIAATNYKPYETAYVRAADVTSNKLVTNILLIGTDNRSTDDASRSDAMIIVSINRKSGKLSMTSVLRDCYVEIPGYGQNRINHAYQMGGPALLIQTIEENFKIGIDSYVQVDFYSFIDAIDAIGGVDINVTEAELSYVNGYVNEVNLAENQPIGYSFLQQPGYQTLNGRQALGYSRIRYIGTDFARTERQRTVLNAMLDKMKKNPILFVKACNSILGDLTTNIDDHEMTMLLMGAALYITYDIEQNRVPFDGTWWNAYTPSGQEVLGINFEQNNAILRSVIYD